VGCGPRRRHGGTRGAGAGGCRATGDRDPQGPAGGSLKSRLRRGPRGQSPRELLSHVDDRGAARMVDVGAKSATERRAVARGRLLVSRETLALVRDGRTPKGDVLSAARIAGLMAAMRTRETIPLSPPV